MRGVEECTRRSGELGTRVEKNQKEESGSSRRARVEGEKPPSQHLRKWILHSFDQKFLVRSSGQMLQPRGLDWRGRGGQPIVALPKLSLACGLSTAARSKLAASAGVVSPSA